MEMVLAKYWVFLHISIPLGPSELESASSPEGCFSSKDD